MFNVQAVKEALDQAGLPFDFQADGTLDPYPEPNNPTQQQLEDAEAIVAAHNPANLSTRQAGIAQLINYLDSRMEDLRFGDYAFRLFKRLDDLLHQTPLPNLADTTTEVYAALRANRDTDANHALMYNRFLWYVQRTKGIVLVSGDLPASPTAAQAQAINDAAFVFATRAVTQVNMLLWNLRG